MNNLAMYQLLTTTYRCPKYITLICSGFDRNIQFPIFHVVVCNGILKRVQLCASYNGDAYTVYTANGIFMVMCIWSLLLYCVMKKASTFVHLYFSGQNSGQSGVSWLHCDVTKPLIVYRFRILIIFQKRLQSTIVFSDHLYKHIWDNISSTLNTILMWNRI